MDAKRWFMRDELVVGVDAGGYGNYWEVIALRGNDVGRGVANSKNI